jgi:hypothetical protein
MHPTFLLKQDASLVRPMNNMALCGIIAGIRDNECYGKKIEAE